MLGLVILEEFPQSLSPATLSSIRYKCATCEKIHDGLPDLGFDAPIYWHGKHDSKTSLLDSDLCVLNGKDFFLRALLEIPIPKSGERLGWGIWSSVSRDNFDLYAKGEQLSGSYFGWFSNHLPGYEDTVNLKCMLHLQDAGLRPLVELGATDHQLAIDQREGITVERALELIELSGIRILSV